MAVMYRCRKCRQQCNVFSAVLVKPQGCDEDIPEDSSMVYLDIDKCPEWIIAQIQQFGYTKGKLKCSRCGRHLGSFDFLRPQLCVCRHHHLPAVHLSKNRLDVLQARVSVVTRDPRSLPAYTNTDLDQEQIEVNAGEGASEQSRGDSAGLSASCTITAGRSGNRRGDHQGAVLHHASVCDQNDTLAGRALALHSLDNMPPRLMDKETQVELDPGNFQQEQLHEALSSSNGNTLRQAPQVDARNSFLTSDKQVQDKETQVELDPGNFQQEQLHEALSSSNGNTLRQAPQVDARNSFLTSDKQVQDKETQVELDPGNFQQEQLHEALSSSNGNTLRQAPQVDARNSFLTSDKQVQDKETQVELDPGNFQQEQLHGALSSSNGNTLRQGPKVGVDARNSFLTSDKRAQVLVQPPRVRKRELRRQRRNAKYDDDPDDVETYNPYRVLRDAGLVNDTDVPDYNTEEEIDPLNQHVCKGEGDCCNDWSVGDCDDYNIPYDWTCCVCMELYNCPHSVEPCGHTYCEWCLRLLAKSQYNRIVQCPMCRKIILECKPCEELQEQIVEKYPDLVKDRAHRIRKLGDPRAMPLPRCSEPPPAQGPEPIPNRWFAWYRLLRAGTLGAFLKRFMLLFLLYLCHNFLFLVSKYVISFPYTATPEAFSEHLWWVAKLLLKLYILQCVSLPRWAYHLREFRLFVLPLVYICSANMVNFVVNAVIFCTLI